MNPEITLDNLSNGLATCRVNTPLDPNLIAAIASASVQNVATTRIGAPVAARTVNLADLSGGTQNQTEFTFTNSGPTTVTYWFTSLFGETGQPGMRNINDSAVDRPTALGSSISNGMTPNGGDNLFNFNRFILATGGAIVSRVEVTTAAGTGQQNQSLIVRNDYVTDVPCSAPRFAPICDNCYNSAGSTSFTAAFRCPLGVGGGSSFGYPVLPGETVTIRLTTMAVAVNQYVALPGSECCA